MYLDTTTFSNQIKYYLTTNTANFLEMQYEFYKYPLLADLLWFVFGRARGGSRTAATSKMEYFITKRSILDFPAALDPPQEKLER